MKSIDTLSLGDGDFRVNLFYPRIDGNPDSVTIDLYDVRAANSITIKFDFPRNGWVVYSDLMDPDQPENWVEDAELKEVAFIEAWPIEEKKCE